MMTEGFSGAEIEQVVVSALFEAFSQDRALAHDDLVKTIRNMVPLSVTQSEQIMQIRAWADVRAVAATAAQDRDQYGIPSAGHCAIPTGETASTIEESLKRSRGGRSVDF